MTLEIKRVSQKNDMLMRNTSTFLIGLIFLISGILKAADINAFADTLLMLQIPKIYYLAPIITALEIFLAFGFLFQWRVQWLSRLSVILISAFTIVLLYGYFKWGVEDCGCFGSGVSLPFGWSFAKNLILLVISYWLFKNGNHQSNKYDKVKLAVIFVLSLATFIPSFLELSNTYIPMRFHQGMSVRNTFLEKMLDSDKNKKNLVFVFSPECLHCKDKVKDINKQLAEFDKVRGIYAQNHTIESINKFSSLTHPGFRLLPIANDSLSKITRQYPYFLVIKNGIIIKASGDL